MIIIIIVIVVVIIMIIIIKAKLGHTFKAFITIIKTLSYLLKINKRTNKKYLCDSNFEMHLYCHIYIYERCFLAPR